MNETLENNNNVADICKYENDSNRLWEQSGKQTEQSV